MSSDSPPPDSSRSGPRPRGSRRVPRMVAAVGITLLVAVVGGLLMSSPRQSSEPMLSQARLALAAGDYQAAEQGALQVLSAAPQSKPALLLAGQATEALGRKEAALDYYDRIPDDESSYAVDARCAAGALLRDAKQLRSAELQFRRALKQDAGSIAAHRGLAHLLALSARSWESIPHRLALIRAGEFQPLDLYMLGLGDQAVENDPAIVSQFHAAVPDDPTPLMALAQFAAREGQFEQARELLKQVIHADPDLIIAHIQLGRLLMQHASPGEFLDWHASLPERAEQHPALWTLRGAWARRQRDISTAVRCFWEAVWRHPNDQPANHQLGRTLMELGEHAPAVPFLERSHRLQQYRNAVRTAWKSDDPSDLQVAADRAATLGLLWEAYGWLQLALTLDPRHKGAQRSLKQLRERRPTWNHERQIPEANPARAIDLSTYPLPRWSASPRGKGQRVVEERPTVPIRFEDDAARAGLAFTYINGGDPLADGIKKMYEFTGGGVAVLDYDLDGWPDLYFAQGGTWPPQNVPHSHHDQLYRNLGNGRFEDVTKPAGIFENGFGQGVTTGDLDNDGFPDLYIANIGGNRLYRNNGDGTFSDVTADSGTAGRRWTTSCLIADLNGDTWPDLYAVNYLTGRDLFHQICGDRKGLALCRPHHFPASQDQLYLNLGDGRFKDVTASSGLVVPDGKGLGIVAADFDGSGRLSLFIANDAVANFYFVNETAPGETSPRFVERALLSGLALNQDGRAEACMGIAAGDVNRDGRLDLFVTNFFEESNTLYTQQGDSLFRDDTLPAGLAEPSLSQLGFGTQVLDADLDGWPDLIVTNGHIDDVRPFDRPYRMPPQFFRNLGNGHFREQEAEWIGPYFQGVYLGRSLARLDWNRDGRDDVVVSHLDAPAALLTNTTPRAGHSLAIQLRGTQSARDAIGTTVTVKCGSDTWVRQLTAGDGYLARNQPLLVIGLGDHARVDELRIRWASGTRERFVDVPPDREYLIVEQSGLFPIVMRRFK